MIAFKKFDKYVAIEREGVSKQIRIYNSRVGALKEWKTREMNLYLYKNGKLATLTIENPDEKKIREAVQQAEKMMKMLPSIPFELGRDGNYRNEKYFDEKVMEDEKLFDMAQEAIEASLQHGDEVAGVIFSEIEKTRIYTPYVEKEDRNSMIYMSARIFKENSSAHAVSCSRRFDGIDVKKAREAGEMASKAKKAERVKEGKYDVVFSPLAFANLLHYFALFSSAFAVDAGYSFLAGKIGREVGSEKLNIYDSGVEKDGIFSVKFDDEGVATRKTAIVEEGVLKGYLHNSTTAKMHGVATTANAGIISPHPWNTIVMPGDHTLEEMIEEVKNGLLITNVWYTRFHNYRSGDFSTIARDVAFYIENGEIKEAMKGARISDNMERMLKGIDALSRKNEQIYWWEVENPVFTPHALIRDVKITTS